MSRTHDIDHFRLRVLQDAIAEALPATWRRRAADFDRVGTDQAADVAEACRRHAWLLQREGVPRAVLAELTDVAEQTWKEAR